MTESTSIQKIRTAVAEVAQSGQKSVEIHALLNFLTSVEADLPLEIEIMKLDHASELAQYKATHDGELVRYKALMDSQNETFRSVLDTAKTALTTGILVNGGATVSLLALIGNLLAKAVPGQPPIAPALVGSVISFAVGVLLGAIATGSTYCAQYCYHMKYERSGAGFHIFTVLLVLSSYAAFVSGVISAFHAFIK